MQQRSTVSPQRRDTIAGFLREQSPMIMADWERAMRKVMLVGHLSGPALRDHIPSLLDRIADLIAPAVPAGGPELHAEAERHALDRLEDGFDLAEVVMELTMLRDCISRLWERHGGGAHIGELRLLDRVVDRVLVASSDRYARVTDRVLRALDRVSSTALDATDLEELLRRLMATFQIEVPTVDSTAILIRHGDELVVSAATGPDEDALVGRSVRIGEGFAGRVAASRRPLDQSDPSPAEVRMSNGHGNGISPDGVRTRYGVPLLDGGDLLGVAHMASRRVPVFSDLDRALLSAMASRASAGVRQVSLRQKAEERARELEDSERRFRATFENAAVGIALVAVDGTWLRLNARYCEIVGRTHDELMGHSFGDVILAEVEHDGRELLRRLIEEGEGERYTGEHRCVRGDGRTAWVSLSVSPVPDALGRPEYFVAAIQDVTAQRTLHDRLGVLARASAILGSTLDLQQTLENVASSAVPLVADCCMVDVIDAGDDLGALVALAHRDPDKVSLVRQLRHRAGSGPGIAQALRTGESQLIREVDADGAGRLGVDPHEIEVLRRLGIRSYLCVPIVREEGAFGVLSLANAESGRLFGEDDLELAEELARRAAIAIEHARLHRESERAVELRNQTLAIVSHDLRNPLFTIGLSTDVLLRDPAVIDNPKVKNGVEMIKRNAGRASRLINDLLDVSSLQSGKLTLELRAFDLHRLVLEAVETHQPLAERAGITLRADLQAHGVSLHADRDRLLEVLANLVGNAIKFCSEGDTVTVRAQIVEDHALLSVADTGPGIEAEQIGKIFAAYAKGRQKESGTGLGLFIAHGIVESHGGRLWVESTAGKGCEFFVELAVPDATKATTGTLTETV